MGELNLDELERHAAAWKDQGKSAYPPSLVRDLVARIRDLEQDAARLDWLAHHGASLRKDHDGARLWYLVVPYHTGTPVDDYPRHPTPRAAIDAARKENHTRPNVHGTTFMDPPGTRRQHVQD